MIMINRMPGPFYMPAMKVGVLLLPTLFRRSVGSLMILSCLMLGTEDDGLLFILGPMIDHHHQ